MGLGLLRRSRPRALILSTGRPAFRVAFCVPRMFLRGGPSRIVAPVAQPFPAVLFDFLLLLPINELEGAPSFALFCEGWALTIYRHQLSYLSFCLILLSLSHPDRRDRPFLSRRSLSRRPHEGSGLVSPRLLRQGASSFNWFDSSGRWPIVSI